MIKSTMKHIKKPSPKCERCRHEIDDPKRFSLVFNSKVHPGLIFDKNTEFPLDFYEEYDEAKSFITINCPTFSCQTTFEIDKKKGTPL